MSHILTDGEFESLKALLPPLPPHAHPDGRDECSICDESIVSAVVREFHGLAEAKRAAVQQEVVAHLLHVRFPGGDRIFATLPGYNLAPDETLVSVKPLGIIE